MIVLDTNILSEMIKPAPAAGVEAWLATQQPAEIFTTTITQAEMLYGVRQLPPGRRKIVLEALVFPIFDRDFVGRILPFDSSAADA